MILKAVLTTGWPDSPDNKISALQLHEMADNKKAYREELKKQVLALGHRKEIYCLEGIFRRSTSGFGPIQTLGSMLVDFDENIRCHIDAFAFAFLKGAKNYDTFMEVDEASQQKLEEKRTLWKDAVSALTEFERLGNDLPKKWTHLRTPYLALRSIVGRNSARDERRTLVVLLVTGPATSDEIKEDLRLNYSLSKRVMRALVDTGALTYRQNTAQYAICLKTIPVVLFLVRELMGLDLLNMLESIKSGPHG